MSPTSWAFATISAAWVWCSSYSAAFGRISFSANSRASSLSAFCSSESANDGPVAAACGLYLARVDYGAPAATGGELAPDDD